MKLHGKAEDAAEKILDSFRNGNLPQAMAPIFIHRKDAIPCRSWSWNNQLLAVLAGTMDARGMKQWNNVGRKVKKGSRAIHILAPLIGKKTEKDDTGAEVIKKIVFGFKTIPVFRYEDTEGEPLPGDDPDVMNWLQKLPLLPVAKEWGLKVTTYSGRQNAPLGWYRIGKEIALGVENLATWAHELVHAADHRLNNLKETGQHWRSETVAELGGAILLYSMGYTRDADLGGAWQYIETYAKRENKDPLSCCIQVLKRTCEAVDLILRTAEAIQTGNTVKIAANESESEADVNESVAA